MKNNDPAFLFYSSDFITGVQDLTYEERGQYITMLCIQHQKGIVSSKWLSINLPNASSDVLAKFEKDDEGNFFNPRLRDEAEKRKSYKPKKIAAATLGGLISKSGLSKAKAKQIRYKFNIEDYDNLDTEEIKQSVSKWFKQMLNLLEDENENVNVNVNKDKEVVSSNKNVTLKNSEIEKLASELGIDGYNFCIEKLSNYKLSKGKQYKSDYGAINSWVKKEWQKEKSSAEKEKLTIGLEKIFNNPEEFKNKKIGQ